MKNVQNACRRKIINIADNCFKVDKVIKCLIDSRQVDGLIQVLRLSSPMKQPKHLRNTTYILLKIVSFYLSKSTLENINYLLKSIMSLAPICRMMVLPIDFNSMLTIALFHYYVFRWASFGLVYYLMLKR